MICSALVFAAAMFAGLTEVEVKNRRRNEMLGNVIKVVLGMGYCDCFYRGGGQLHSSKLKLVANRVVIVITDWARSGMTQEDRVIGEPEAEAVLSGKVADKE
jgi:hypothetical protein